jgi:hypothetical protein
LSGTLQHSQVDSSSFVRSTLLTNRSHVDSDQVHDTHSCDTKLCPSTCELCKRPCDEPHLHGLTLGTHHLCGSVLFLVQRLLYLNIVMNRETHACPTLCSEPGICQIDTAPQSIQATFTGRHETFQYTKVVHSYHYLSPHYLSFVCLIVYTRFVEC